MDITRMVTGESITVAVDGRLDGYWTDHLDSTLADVVREGHHRIRLDCSKVSFLSSAGIVVLIKFHKELASINGTFHVVAPSAQVSSVLRITRLTEILIEKAGPGPDKAEHERRGRRSERDGVGFDVFDLGAAARLTYRAFGTPVPLTAGTFADEHCISLESLAPTFAIGVGAFGEDFADCQARFGELLSVAGTTVYQPADGTNVADYLLASGSLGASIRVLYGLGCEGPFSHLIRFETPGHPPIGMARLLASCLDEAATGSLGFVIVAEAAGLVGAALSRPPTEPYEEADLFAYPGVRARLSFTAERAFRRSVALAAGVVTRSGVDDDGAQLRPIGAGCLGHVHAAAFHFRPIKKGFIDLHETVSGLFEADRLLGVLHLLHDDRGAAGAGESELIRGACWIGPIAGW